MSKKQVAFIIIVAVIVSWLLNLTAGRFLMAKISTWPVLNKWKLLSPQAPIVINNRETVRVSDSGDVVQAASQIKSQLGTVVLVAGNSETVEGTALNITSDGSFVTAAGTFSDTATGTYFTVLSDGRSAPVTEKTSDAATSLVFFKASLDSVPVVNVGSSKDLSPGEKILFLQSSLSQYTDKVLTGSVSFSQADLAGQTFQSDYPRRSFGASAPGVLINGQGLADTNSDIVGIWNGFSIISSDVLKQEMSLYFNNSKKISNPSFGFSYSIVTTSQAKLENQSAGAKIIAIVPASSAQKAGLAVGDIITSVSGKKIDENSGLEEILQKNKAGDTLLVTVLRKNQTVSLTFTVGELDK